MYEDWVLENIARWGELTPGLQREILSKLVGQQVCVFRGAGCFFLYGEFRYRVTTDLLIQLEVNGVRCSAIFGIGDIVDVSMLAGEDVVGIWIR